MFDDENKDLPSDYNYVYKVKDILCSLNSCVYDGNMIQLLK